MKVKRVLSLVLSLVIIMGLAATPIFAENTNTITAYLNVTKYGEFVKDKSNNPMAQVAVKLSGKESYTLDDVFKVMHDTYYDGKSEGGYASSNGDFGLYITKFWGNESGNYGYQVNGGTETVSGLGHTVEVGDYIDACIYKNLYPDTEGYAKFDVSKAEIHTNEELELFVSYVSGYDDNWNSVFSPCDSAIVTINGEETEFITDENGKAVIKFEKEGRYVISALKRKVINGEIVPAITAPVCVVYVSDGPEIQILHNIAQMYALSDFEVAAGNLPWIVMDMIIYEKLFPESVNCLTESRKEEALEIIVSTASEATKAGDLAKSILALRALGYDARNVYTKDFKKVDVVAKLTELIDNSDSEVTNIYTLPYVMIALSQAEDYATAAQKEKLINAAIGSKELWQSVEYGTDAMTPMILTLAPFYDTNDEVKTIIDETVEILKNEQREDGLIDGPVGYESASTGLAICALSAVGIDSKQVKKAEKDLIDGLVSTANGELNGFANAFATEQGFRGLLAWQLISKNKALYDFKEYKMHEANVSGIEKCPVIFDVTPSDSSVTVKKNKEISQNCFDLGAGTYSYKVSASGYKTKTDSLTITDADVQNHVLKTITITLNKKSSGGGGGIVITPMQNTDDKTEENSEQDIVGGEETVKQDDFIGKTFSDVSTGDWFYSAVKYVYENNLFKGTDIGFEPNKTMSRAMLVTVLHRLALEPDATHQSVFCDVPENVWYTEAVKWASENKIVNGVTNTVFNPDADITRQQLALILYRYASYTDYDINIGENVDILSYVDCDEISEYAVDAVKYAISAGIMSGNEDGAIAPQKFATRAEVATMLMRFAEMK